MHFKKCLLFAYCLQKWTAKRAPILSRYTSSFSCARDFSTARSGEEERSFFFFFLFPSCASHAVPIISWKVSLLEQYRESVKASHSSSLILRRNASSILRTLQYDDLIRCNDIDSPQPPECLRMFSSDFADFFTQNGVGWLEWPPARRPRSALLAQTGGSSQQQTGLRFCCGNQGRVV